MWALLRDVRCGDAGAEARHADGSEGDVQRQKFHALRSIVRRFWCDCQMLPRLLSVFAG